MGTEVAVFVTDFLLGGAAAFSKTATAPIERIKLLMQSQHEMIKSGVLDRPYSGLIDCFRRSVKSDGVVALWRGNLANILRYAPTQALNFGLRGVFKRLWTDGKRQKSNKRKFFENIMAGGMAGAASLTLVYPLDYARTRLGNDSGSSSERKFKGILDLYRKTMRVDGVSGLYRGFCVSILGVFIYRGLYFGLYDSCKPFLGSWQNHWAGSFALGWAATITAGMCYYPIDTVRRRMMMTSGEAQKYANSRDALRHIIKTGGIKSLFYGAGANIIRSIAGALVLTGYDQMQAILSSRHLINDNNNNINNSNSSINNNNNNNNNNSSENKKVAAG